MRQPFGTRTRDSASAAFYFAIPDGFSRKNELSGADVIDQFGLTAIVATLGRPSLATTVKSIRQFLPSAGVSLVPTASAAQGVREAFPDERVLEPAHGLYAAWNAAIRAAKTSHVMFINDDDVLVGTPARPSGLERIVEDRLTFLPFRREDRWLVQPSLTRLRGSDAIRLGDVLRGTRVMINTGVWPVSLFDEVGYFDESYRIAGDTEWLQRLVGRPFAFAWPAGPTYLQKRGAGRLSSRTPENRAQLLEEAQRVRAAIEQGHGHRLGHRVVADAWFATRRRGLESEAV